MGSKNTQKKKDHFYDFLFWPPKRFVGDRKASYGIPKTVRNVVVFKSQL